MPWPIMCACTGKCFAEWHHLLLHTGQASAKCVRFGSIRHSTKALCIASFQNPIETPCQYAVIYMGRIGWCAANTIGRQQTTRASRFSTWTCSTVYDFRMSQQHNDPLTRAAAPAPLPQEQAATVAALAPATVKPEAVGAGTASATVMAETSAPAVVVTAQVAAAAAAVAVACLVVAKTTTKPGAAAAATTAAAATAPRNLLLRRCRHRRRRHCRRHTHPAAQPLQDKAVRKTDNSTARTMVPQDQHLNQ